MNQEPYDQDDDEIIYVSKSEMKRDMTALQELGERLVPIDKKQLAQLDLPEKLFEALVEAKRLTAHGAIARQKQLIGKLMRQVNPEPIKAYLDTISGASDIHNAWLHRIERQREKLLTDPKALEAFVAEHPSIDVQRLRQMIRNAQKEREQQKPPKFFREIFQLLKEYLPEPEIPGLKKKPVATDEE